MQTYDLEFHPYAQLFPLLAGAEYQALLHDIEVHGQQTPIVLFEGRILDGRNRYRVCAQLQHEPLTEPYTGADALGHVLFLNLYRRQLSVAQRALIAAELSSLSGTRGQGVGPMAPGEPVAASVHMAIEAAARVVGVSPRSVSSACKVVRQGVPALLEAVRQGDVRISAAEQVATLEASVQQALCAAGLRTLRKTVRTLRAHRQSLLAVAGATAAMGNAKRPTTCRSCEVPAGLPGDGCRPVMHRLLALAEVGWRAGHGPERVAAELWDGVGGPEGLDRQWLHFVSEVVRRLCERVAVRR